jgi:cleavage and polyadenylation specificity factor subunit 2
LTMSSIIRFEPLLGAYEDSPAVCYFLEIDGFAILLDCGWNDLFDVQFVEPLRKIAKQVDAVLLSHGDIYHLGALPYAVGKLGLQCPVYATLPVYKMGQMSMYDTYQAHANNEEFDVFNLDDVDAAFERLVPLKYSQHYHLAGKGKGITITAYAAGHTIGGSLWKIRKENEEIVYAVDFNHNKERHLNGGALQSLTRPSLIITDAYNALYAPPSRKLRDAELIETILSTLRNNGNVLMPTDTASRVLELALLLDQHWTFQKLPYPIVLLTNVSYNTIEFAKSMLEWMSDTVMKTFDAKRENPFEFRYIRMLHSLEELHRIPEAKVVLASTASLETGWSRDLFGMWCSFEKNTLIFTERAIPGSLARSLIENPKPRPIVLTVRISRSCNRQRFISNRLSFR